MQTTKESVALKLAQAHYTIERGIIKIMRLLADAQREADQQEPIKLLEVNEDTTADGITPIFFGPHPTKGIHYPTVIVEVTPEEFDRIERNPFSLPNGWRLGDELPRASVPAGA